MAALNYNNIFNEVSKLTKEEQWLYFKWEWLRRNVSYTSSSKKTYEGYKGNKHTYQRVGLYQEYIERFEKIRTSGKPQNEIDRHIQVESFFFTMSCGLVFSVDPVSGKWSDCQWATFNKTFYETLYFMEESYWAVIDWKETPDFWKVDHLT